MAYSVTVLRAAGPPGAKRNLAILGDGLTAADQAAYNTWVDTTVMAGVFAHDYFFEDASAWNIYRVNLESTDSGVSTRTYDEHGTPADASDDTISSETVRNTALGMILSGSWAHCWLEYGTNTEARIKKALDRWVSDYQFVLIVLSNPGFGGCGGGGRAHVPMGVDWATIAHEFGHGIGGLADEYSDGAWTAGDPGVVNLTTNTNRATLKWRQFVDPTTPVPTGVGSAANYDQGTRPATWNSNTDVGLFEGGGTNNTGVYRPVESCRMNSNTPAYCPVCYTSFRASTTRTRPPLPQLPCGSVLGQRAQRRARPQRQLDPSLPLQRLAARPRLQPRRSSAGFVAVQAERPVLRRRLQRRREGRGRRVQRDGLGCAVDARCPCIGSTTGGSTTTDTAGTGEGKRTMSENTAPTKPDQGPPDRHLGHRPGQDGQGPRPAGGQLKPVGKGGAATGTGRAARNPDDRVCRPAAAAGHRRTPAPGSRARALGAGGHGRHRWAGRRRGRRVQWLGPPSRPPVRRRHAHRRRPARPDERVRGRLRLRGPGRRPVAARWHRAWPRRSPVLLRPARYRRAASPPPHRRRGQGVHRPGPRRPAHARDPRLGRLHAAPGQGGGAVAPLTERSLGEQYLEEMRQVVGLVGLPEWVLPSAMAEAGKRTAQG